MRAFISRRLPVGAALLLSLPLPALAAEDAMGPLDLTGTVYGFLAVLAFVLAYGLVIGEEVLHLRKSKPVMVAAGVIWALVGLAYHTHGHVGVAEEAVRENLFEYAELMLFLLAAMTYISTMEERQVFDALRGWLVTRGFSLRGVYWVTGALAFFISPVADNLTTALLMAAVVMAVAGDNRKFVIPACINIVVGANAGGAFSPFGDITTLMVWQRGVIEFSGFFDLFVPAVVNWVVPAALMSLAVPKVMPAPLAAAIRVKRGGFVVIGLFVVTIVMAVSFHNFLDLPPVLGMMTGLGLLKFFGYYLKVTSGRDLKAPNGCESLESGTVELSVEPGDQERAGTPFDIFTQLQRAEWDTLMFFYGVILCVGGLGTLGYLALLSESMYTGLGATWANVLVGLLSSVVDNIPVMFAVLTMNPDMSAGQWLLVTLTAGVGGSLLSVGSAAGVALMGQARGLYTFFAHLKWTWAIALGYAASIWVHFLINASMM